MQVFFSPLACSIVTRILLNETGLSADFARVDLHSKTLSEGENYLALNKKGKVPMLTLDDGASITDGTAIMCYLADQAPESGLLPAVGDTRRYQVLAWLGFIATELHKGVVWFQFHPAPPAEAKAFALTMLPTSLKLVEDTLEGQDFLTGSDFTVADAYLFWTLMILQHLEISIAEYPNLSAFFARCFARPSVSGAINTEKALIAA
ncbi:MAG: glutathione transferase GstA [Ponticaulis sp.]|nr:glutathione transferase GstA [Ponticaulis sp.]